MPMGDLFSEQTSLCSRNTFSFGKWEYNLIKIQSQFQNANCMNISLSKLTGWSYFVKVRVNKRICWWLQN